METDSPERLPFAVPARAQLSVRRMVMKTFRVKRSYNRIIGMSEVRTELQILVLLDVIGTRHEVVYKNNSTARLVRESDYRGAICEPIV
jgi:hypothetical protein